jgi:DNA-binding MarR family transcriptional regulator
MNDKPDLLDASDLETRLHTDHASELRLWLRMLTCTQLIERNIRGALREKFDTTLPRFDLMSQLERAPQGLKMNELSRRLMVTGGNITGITDQLVSEGLVERLAVEGDRRAYLVRLTPAGHKSFETMAQAHEAWIVQAFDGLGEKDIAQLSKLLGRVKDSAIAMNLMTDQAA